MNSHFDILCKEKCVISIFNTDLDYKSDYDAIVKVAANKDLRKDYEYLWVDGIC